MRRIHPVLTVGAVGLALTCTVGGVRATQDKPPTVKSKPFQAVPSVDGRYNFVAYCASCHGTDGKGAGPAAPALKGPVPDLTTIARRHGKFDPLVVERIVAGPDRPPTAHGSLDMPVWGPIFKSGNAEASAVLRVRNLVKYLQTIQASGT